MRVLLVVQRHGRNVAGGAEHLVRELAVRLARRNHEVEVLTSTATSYVDWASVVPAGSTTEDGVLVHRLASVRRDNRTFGPLHERAMSSISSGNRFSPVVDHAWARTIGPSLGDLDGWLQREHSRFDVIVFSGFMFTTTTHGLPSVAGQVPTVLLSVAHDEAPLRSASVARAVRHATGLMFLTEEEQRLVQQRFRPDGLMEVTGAGISDPPSTTGLDVREELGLGPTDRYLVCVGRIDPAKGMSELVDFHRELRRRDPACPALVLVGSEVAAVARHDGLVVTGFVDEAIKWDIVREATLLVQPSYFESFSYSLIEGWQVGIPALVQRRCDVLEGHVLRCAGGLSYGSFSEFDAALSTMLKSTADRRAMGDRGRRYVQRFHWEQVLPRVEDLLTRSVDRWSQQHGEVATA